MNTKSILAVLCFFAIIFSACKKSKVTPMPDPDIIYISDLSFKIVAYMPSYRDPASIADAKYKMITHLFYAFLEPAAAGDGSLNPIAQPARFDIIRAKAKLNNLKMGIAISGTNAYFVKIVASPAARSTFVKNIVDFAKRYNLAGVDMDWEYPSTTDGSDAGFALLMKELSAALHKNQMFLSAAITAGVYAGGVREGIRPEVFPHVDFFNIMQYDGPNFDPSEPLNHASYKMSIASLDQWLINKKMPKEKAVMGIPLYGRSSNASKGYRDIEASGVDINLNLANVQGVDYGFNGLKLVRQKVQLAKERTNGIMFWEFSHDSNTENSLIKAANDELGRTY